uniref:Uncharacterized protein n=1 Tax=Arundo donax TaxID=35708 RepID=A0A0A9F999_ARUDO
MDHHKYILPMLFQHYRNPIYVVST